MESVHALTFIRRMRGGAQSFLVQANDGKFYVVKTTATPQGRRTLVNEWIGSQVLTALGVRSAAIRPIYLSQEWLSAHSEIRPVLSHGRRGDIRPGFHLGSEHVGGLLAPVYDFLPRSFLPRVANLPDFIGALAADKWLGNTDARQCVFHRCQMGHFWATMIDHGYVFDGPQWGFRDAPSLGRYFDHSVYDGVAGWAAFAPWIDKVHAIDRLYLRRLFEQAPAEWLEEDRAAVMCMVDALIRRQTKLRNLIEDMRNSQGNPFVNWAYPA